MATHEFGIMDIAPESGVRYDEYEPEKYSCIAVDDIHIEGILERFCNIHTYAHTTDLAYEGLAYCGVTLIPPESHLGFINVISEVGELNELTQLFKKALSDEKYIIHYGL